MAFTSLTTTQNKFLESYLRGTTRTNNNICTGTNTRTPTSARTSTKDYGPSPSTKYKTRTNCCTTRITYLARNNYY